MNELNFKTIKVSSIQDNGLKIVLLEDKDKYNFWKNKKDGSETKSYSQFKSMRVEAGKEYPIAFKEEEKTFTNDSGKQVTFMDRSIMYFATQEAGNGSVPVSKPVQKNQSSTLPTSFTEEVLERIEALELEVFGKQEKEEDELKIEDVPF